MNKTIDRILSLI
uniref:Uncharacterized protein n=1 Tax=Rhizophora mucronata TaxID=61149 RepID=A0A2P2J642_RHIMU